MRLDLRSENRRQTVHQQRRSQSSHRISQCDSCNGKHDALQQGLANKLTAACAQRDPVPPARAARADARAICNPAMLAQAISSTMPTAISSMVSGLLRLPPVISVSGMANMPQPLARPKLFGALLLTGAAAFRQQCAVPPSC